RLAAGPAPVMTDDLCSIEYSTSRAMFERLQPRTLQWLDDLRIRPLPADLYPGVDAVRIAESREARRRIPAVIPHESGRPPAHAHLASCLLKIGRRDEARAECLKALQHDSSNALARQLLGQIGP